MFAKEEGNPRKTWIVPSYHPWACRGKARFPKSIFKLTCKGFKDPKNSKSFLKRQQSGGAESTDLCVNPDPATY